MKKRWISICGMLAIVWLFSGCATSSGVEPTVSSPCQQASGVAPYSLEEIAYRQQCS